MFDVFLLFFLGTIFGSFVSVVSYRMPKVIPFVKGRSFCPKCRKTIKWHDNIPLFSFLFLGGRCKDCQNKISLRYPLIELTSGIGFVAVYNFTALGINLFFYLLIFLLFLTIFVIDLENQIIPDPLIFTGVTAVSLYLLFFNENLFFSSMFSGFIGSSFLMMIHLLTKGHGMGLGDVKFAIFGGMFVGFKMLPFWLILSFLTGAIAGCILILLGKAGLKTKLAFGPFLVVGVFLVLVLGESLVFALGF